MANLIALINPTHLSYCVPILCMLGYMLMHEELSAVAIVLTMCLALTGLMVYFAFSEKVVNDRKNRVNVQDVKKFQAESIEETCERLQLDVLEAQESLNVLYYLKKAITADKSKGDLAVRAVECGAVQQTVLLMLNNGHCDERDVACIELLNEIIAIRKARNRLFATEADLRDVIDGFVEYCTIAMGNEQHDVATAETDDSNFLNHHRRPKKEQENGVLTLMKDVTGVSKDNDTSVKDSTTLLEQARLRQLCRAKALVTLGLMCDECSDAQTRIADRRGVTLLVGLLEREVIACSKATKTIGNTNDNAGVAGSEARSGTGNSRQVERTSMSVCKWACWCLFNLTLDHPPNKFDFYHANGIRIVIDVLKAHVGCVDVHRQGLALLLSMISPDTYAKFSMAQARQMMMANGLVDLVESNKLAFRLEKDITLTSRALMNHLAIDYS